MTTKTTTHSATLDINDLGAFQTNAFGDRYLFSLNRDMFDKTGADTLFRSHYGDSLFDEDTFYIIGGADSGLLIDYVQKRGVPAGARYLFVEQPAVLDALTATPPPPVAGISLCGPEDWETEAEALAIKSYGFLDRIRLIRSLAAQNAYHLAYLPFWRELKGEVDQYRWHLRTTLTLHAHTRCQLINLTENHYPAQRLQGAFAGKTAVLLTGGPSLDEFLPWVQAHRDQLLVVTVSRISKRLQEAGLVPDIIVSVDPFSFNFGVSQEMMAFQETSLLIHANHLVPGLLSMWGGRKAFLGQRYPWKTGNTVENFPSHGPTVTNAAFWVLVEMGVRQIVLLGADFCYSPEGFTHAQASVEHTAGPILSSGDQRVTTHRGQQAETTNEYLLAAQNLSLMAKEAQERGCRTVNPAANAMQLEHIDHLDLQDIEPEPLGQPAAETLAALIPLAGRQQHQAFYDELQQDIKPMLNELRSIKTLAQQALRYNHQLFDPQRKGGNFIHKLDRIEKTLKRKHADSTDFVKRYGMRRFITMIRPDEERERSHKDVKLAGETYYRAYLDTVPELTEILQQTQRRIASRREEEQDSPDLTRLLQQWDEDEQYGRALRWQQTHTHGEPSGKTQQAMQALTAKHRQQMEDVKQHIANTVNKRGDLQGIQARALEYLTLKEQAGLQQLIAGLGQHQDQAQAGPLMQLIQAYLMELSDKSTAVTLYQQIDAALVQFDALKRLLMLSMEFHDYDAALRTLARLAEQTPAFIPLLADMLHLLGDSEKAIGLYTDYMLLNPDDLHSMFKLGKLYQALGSAEGLEWTMQYILEKDPINTAAKELLENAREELSSETTTHSSD
jgi:hypothetical protein